MKIGEFLRENQLSVGDNALFLLERLGITSEELLKRLESEIGESAKMSKSKANVVDPEEAVEEYGADTIRLYILFAAPPEQDFEWTDEGIQGAYRFLRRLWNFITEREEWLRDIDYTGEELRKLGGKARKLRRIVHETLEGYLTDMEKRYQLNTAIARVMKLLNELTAFNPETDEEKKAMREGVDVLLKLLAPITPHICEELWQRLGGKGLISLQPLPEVDSDALKVEEVELPVQINGKLRARVKIPYGAEEKIVREIALGDERVRKYIEGKEIKKVVYIKNRLVNIVVS